MFSFFLYMKKNFWTIIFFLIIFLKDIPRNKYRHFYSYFVSFSSFPLTDHNENKTYDLFCYGLFLSFYVCHDPVGICLFKVNNGNIRTMCEICPHIIITIMVPERRHNITCFNIAFDIEVIHFLIYFFNLLFRF